MVKVLIQGIEGSNHDTAAREFFAHREIDTVSCSNFKEVFLQLQKNRNLLAMIAMENTLAGSLLPNYALLRQSGFSILGEYKLRIRHHLMALHGQTVETIRKVYSHPMALAQCEDFFEAHPHLLAIESADTAYSAKWISQKQQNAAAAIAGKHAAKLFGLEIIATDIESNPHNFTRFLLVGDTASYTQNQKPDKSSLVFSLPHRTGSLAKILNIIALESLNLTKIQSMPIIGREWEYLFYVDMLFADYSRYLRVLDAIRPLCVDLKVLGEYVSYETCFQEKAMPAFTESMSQLKNTIQV